MCDASDYDSDASSNSRFTHPTSCARDELYQPSSSTTRYDPLDCLTPSPPRYKFLDDYTHYLPRPSRTVAPGLTSRGKLTTSHPIVSLLLSRLHSVSPVEGRIENEKWWTKTFKQWTVNDILDLTDDEGNDVVLTDLQAECVFVLAALRVSNHPMHPKHFTLWGKEWAARTAERVQKVLEMNPCPIAYYSNWMSTEQTLWHIDRLQVNAYPPKKEGKKANNGMLLRKRKAGASAHVTFDPLAGVVVEGVTDMGPSKKRARTSAKEMRAKSAATQSGDVNGGLLEELPLPEVVVSFDRSSSGSSTAVSPMAGKDDTKGTKLELIGVDAPVVPSIIPAQPHAPARRSARQAHRRGNTATPSSTTAKLDANADALTPASDMTSLATTPSARESVLPDVPEVQVRDAEEGRGEELDRPVITRARSSSSSCGSTATAVSNGESSGADTAVEEASQIQNEKEKAKTKVAGHDKTVRSSARTRRPAVKQVETDEIQQQQETLVPEKVVSERKKSMRQRMRK